MKGIMWLAIAGIGLFSLIGCGRGASTSGVVATVGNDPITAEDFYDYMEFKRGMRVQVQGQAVELPVADTVGFQVLQDLVTQKLLLQWAKEEGAMPTDQDVKNEIDFQKQLNPRFVQDLTANGMTLEQVKNNLRLDLAREKILTKGITVTREEANDYIVNNPKNFMEPATADTMWIWVRDEATKKLADKELVSGQAFKTVAMHYSVDPAAKLRQATFGQRRLDGLKPEIRKAIDKAGIGQQTDWVKLEQAGFAKFYIEKKEPEKKRVIDEAVKKSVMRAIALDRGTKAIDFEKRLNERLKSTKIDVQRQSLQVPWKTQLELIKRAEELRSPSTSLPPTPAPAPSGTSDGKK